MDYPGDKADPKDVARWMATVAEEEYGLPGILPVMTSCVEITAAWTGPGDVTKVTGYLWPVDGCSVGYFQQQADYLGCGYFGWGSIEHLIQADYSLRRFCEEAVKYKKWGWNQNSADELGKWCQVVQRSGVPDAYRDKGYPMAKALLEAAQEQENGGKMNETPVKVNGTENPQPPLDPSEAVLVEKEPAQLIANASGLIIGLLALSGVLLTQEDHELIKGTVALLTPILINCLQGRAIRASVYSPASLRKISS